MLIPLFICYTLLFSTFSPDGFKEDQKRYPRVRQAYKEKEDAVSDLLQDKDSKIMNLWSDLKKGYDLFNETKKLPRVSFQDNGAHRIQSN